MRRRWQPALFLVVSMLVAGSVPARAHERALPLAEVAVDHAFAERVGPAPVSATDVSQSPPAQSAFPWVAIWIVAALAVMGCYGPRRAFALAVILVLAFLAFESGVHSVHHLGHRSGKATCAVASAASHLADIDVSTAIVDSIFWTAPQRVVLERHWTSEVHPPAAHQGRAPPLAV